MAAADPGIIDDARMRLRQVPCPAGEELADAREGTLPNTPAVRCRITHETLTPENNPSTLVSYCCNPKAGCGGYTTCPVWQLDKDRIDEALRSFGDEREMRAQQERTWRDDLTGSEHGDTSFMDAIESSVQPAIEAMKEREGTGVVGRSGLSDGLPAG